MRKSIIVDLDKARDFYWGVIPKEEMMVLVSKLKKTKNFDAELQSLNTLSTKTSYITSSNRTRSIRKSFIPNKDWRVLEVGTGYGQITAELARNFGHVYSIDATRLHLEFTEARISSLGLTNVTLFHVPVFEEDFLNHPKLLESDYDLIVVNGVLEWVGSGTQQGNPKLLQRMFLQKLSNVLKANGVLYLAIENRWYPKWWLRDPHTKQRFVTILPRSLANLYSKIKDGHSYRNLIYSRFGILKMLQNSNLKLEREVLNFYSYREPYVIANFYDYDDLKREIDMSPENYVSRKWKFVLTNCFKLRIINFITPSFTLILNKGDGD